MASTSMSYSTIQKKGSGLNKYKENPTFLRMSQNFQKMSQSLPTGAVSASAVLKSTGDQLIKKDRYIYLDQLEKIPVSICKKSKKSNKQLVREGFFGRADVLKLIQTKKNKQKQYITPVDFHAESKDQHTQALAALQKGEKLLPWTTKEIAEKPFRITFRRHDNLPEGQYDTAFYFDNQEDMKRMMNFLQGIKLLEHGGQAATTLQRLNKSFENQMILKVRKAIAAYANSQKANSQSGSLRFLEKLDKNVVTKFINEWRQRADLSLFQEKERLRNLVASNPLLQTFDQALVEKVSEAWKKKAWALSNDQPKKEDINILFNSLEILNLVKDPVIRVEVKWTSENNDSVNLNGNQLTSSRNFEVKCSFKEDSTAEGTKIWRVIGDPRNMSEEQIRFVNDAYLHSSVNPAGDKFSLHFSEFPLEALKRVEITASVYEDRIRKAYASTSLKLLHNAGKRGKNFWLCLNTNEELQGKFPLIHFKIESRLKKRAQPSSEQAPKTAKLKRFENTGYIDDTFYNYRFKFPIITPDQKELLELTPADWEIMDPKTKELVSLPNQSEFIQRIKYRFLKHYYEKTTKQLSMLKRNANIWAELQTNVSEFLQYSEPQDESLFVDEEKLKDLTKEPNMEQRKTHKVSRQIISFLFKRDVWENKTEFRTLYKQLERLCHKGIPPQSRLDIWSEMGRVVYFIKLTEEEYYNNQGAKSGHLPPISNQDYDVELRSQNVYNLLFEESGRQFFNLFQNVEDDIKSLRESFDVTKLPYEKSLRNICRVFIYWSSIFSDPAKEQHRKYEIAYSRTIATICFGLLVSQNCTLFENDDAVQEYKVFWLLISLVTYILSTYFEINEQPPGVETVTQKKDEQPRRKNAFKTSAARSPDYKGVKCDLLVLKLLLQALEPEIFSKFEEFGIPLEHYFGDHMLNLFFSLFNPGLTFRIWDILFFEGSSANQMKCNRMMVCFIFTLLRQCKYQILKAKNADDLQFIIELYARFETDHKHFIRESYDICKTYLEQKIPPTDTFMEKLSFIKFAFFNKDYNRFDYQIKDIEKKVQGYFQPNLDQNNLINELLQKKARYRGEREESLSYPVLYSLLQSFISRYARPSSIQTGNEQQELGLQGQRVKKVWVKIYQISSNEQSFEGQTIRLTYGEQKNDIKDFDLSNIRYEERFNADELTTQIKIELLEEKSALHSRVLKSAVIDLRAIQPNVFTKLNLLLQEEQNTFRENYAASEVEVVIMLEAPVVDEQVNQLSKEAPEPFIIHDVEDNIYKRYKISKANQTARNDIRKQQKISESTLNTLNVLNKSPVAWKYNFAMSQDEFTTSPIFAPFGDKSALRKIYQTLAKASPNRAFYVSDFFVLLILNVKEVTVNQRYTLLFELFNAFNRSLLPSVEGITLETVKGLASYIYEFFLIQMPRNQLSNLIDLAITGNVTFVKQIIINGKVVGAKTELPVQALNILTNYVQLYHNTKEINLQSSPVLELLQDVFGKEVGGSLVERNTIDVLYETAGRSHQLTFTVDKKWKPLPPISAAEEKAELRIEIGRLLDVEKTVLPLNAPPVFFTKSHFLKVMQKLPLLNYLFSFENLKQTPATFETAKPVELPIQLRSFKYTINFNGETLVSVDLPQEADRVHPSSQNNPKKQKFASLLHGWSGLVGEASRKGESGSRRGLHFPIERPTVASNKLDICLPYSKIIQNIKKAVIRDISGRLTKSLDAAQTISSDLLNKELYYLESDVSVFVNNSRGFTISDIEETPLLTIMALAQQIPEAQDVPQDLEVIFSLKNTELKDPYVEPFNHLALYRNADLSQKWLPCRLKYKFEIVDQVQYQQYDPNSAVVDGYGVEFEKYPKITFNKRLSEVIIREEVDINELDPKAFERDTGREVTNQYLRSGTYSKQDQDASWERREMYASQEPMGK